MSYTNRRFIALALVTLMIAASCSSSDSSDGDTASSAPITTSDQDDVASDPAEGGDTRETNSPTGDDANQVHGVATTDGLWSDGLINLRNGEPLVFIGGEHLLANVQIEPGHNIVVDHEGSEIAPSGRPFEGGETLKYTDEEQTEANVAAYAEVLSFIGPIRDAILYDFDSTSAAEWERLTAVLTVNGIKTEDAPTVDDTALLSSSQVYEYVASGPSQGAAVARYLEEAELELKCLAFDAAYDFTNPEGADHCADHDLEQGSGIQPS